MRNAVLKGFGLNVRRIRLKLGLTQEKLAEISGLHTNYIGGIERGERNVSIVNIVRLAQALQCRMADIFSKVLK